MPRISVIICTYNRSASLLRTLRSLTAQTLDAALWELVVVDNNSPDDTQQVAAGFAAEHPELDVRTFFEPRQGLSHARNRGIGESRGEYVVLIDDDVEVNDDFVRAYLEFFDAHPQAAAAGGRVAPLYEFDPPRWLSPVAERPIAGTLDKGDAVVPLKGRYPTGANMGFRRDVLLDVGAFNPELGRTGKKLLGGEEKDLFVRIVAAGGEIWYVPEARILHIIPESRLTRAYFSRVSRMIGLSERIRTLGRSRAAYAGRLLSEAFKWAATFAIGFWYLVTLRPAKTGYLFILRWNITLGLFGRGQKQ